MTENMAGRGEGLKGLAIGWREVCDKIMAGKGAAKADAEDLAYADALRHCAADVEALEAAAPAGTAAREKAMVTYIRGIVDHDHNLYCRKDGSACVATCVNGRAALATPSPQAPATPVLLCDTLYPSPCCGKESRMGAHGYANCSQCGGRWRP